MRKRQETTALHDGMLKLKQLDELSVKMNETIAMIGPSKLGDIFDAEVREKCRDFGSRDWIYDEIDAWCETSPSERFRY